MNALHDEDVLAIKELLAKVAHEGILCAEVGTWKGYSASIIAEIIKPLNGSLYCVDHWEGSQGFEKQATERDIFNIFKENMKELDLWDVIHPLHMDSKYASLIIAPTVFDFIFIDANHEYEYVKADILGWLPALKQGGIMCGHDWYRPKKSGLGHPGVTKAVEEIFPSFEVMGNSRVWSYKNDQLLWPWD